MGNPQSMQSYPQFIGVLSCTSETPSGRLLLCLLSEGVVDGVGIRVGHAYAKYAKYADYAHMRNMRMRMRIENLIHIFHIQREKTSLFKRQ